ncbi:MAG TPA: hypothetical protein PKL56_16130 [Cyclobacteriaceae bacterium]|nr:hypothetical protein [Cyclobacteriaceae bacterium]HMX88065.1 hypothetical protein [Saprospiraceae bacterium]HMX00898.1 hypothetical protein [Cyclobacteriaceae bacterium]HMY93702.1 hypothetical protein [Cyclobacteriaceae bacterium]HNA12864.1 hypothetical protein [Cyclobacteriaceae bacterium]
MEFPLGMLIYRASCESEESARITGMWYYKEMYAPTTIDEKKLSIVDFKNKRCLFIDVVGTFSQICDLLMQTDRFQKASEHDMAQFKKLTEQLASSANKPIVFDDVNNIQGSALALDTVCFVEETQEDVMEQIKSPKKMVFVTISKDWSLSGDIYRALS